MDQYFSMLMLLSMKFVACELFTPEDIGCYSVLISDGTCQTNCMNINSNFDSSINSSNLTEVFIGSDCFEACKAKGCNETLLGNTECDDICNVAECGWDLGKCGFCNNGCTIEKLLNDEKDEECNVTNCKYDNNQYGWCTPGCKKEDLISTIFKKECNNTQCSMQNGTGMPNECSEGCGHIGISLPVCFEYCDKKECEFMFGLCLCNIGCDSKQMATEGCDENDPCNTESCEWKGGKCLPKCAENCYWTNISNGVCESECFNSDCNWDGSDCGCAKNCPSTFKDSWNHTGECLTSCLVELCQFNYNSCNELGVLANAILQTMYTSSPIMAYYSECNCSNTELLSFSPSNLCTNSSRCLNSNCTYCLGYNNQSLISNCIRYDDFGCILHNNDIIFQGSPVLEAIMDSLSDVVETIPAINNLFTSAKFYFVRSGMYRRIFYNFTVETGGDFSFADALASCIYPYCSIKLGKGEFSFKAASLSKDYMEDVYEPSKFKVSLYRKELIVEGSGYETIIYFTNLMVFGNYYEKLVLKNLVFSGEYLIKIGCKEEKCFYCPLVFDIGNGFYKDDRERIAFDWTHNENCDDGNQRVPFVFYSDTLIENVKFVGFRVNVKNMIQNYGDLAIKNSRFEKIQNIVILELFL